MKQPRRIVLEETGEERSVSYGEWLEYEDGLISQWPDEKYGSNISYKVWREVKESDLSLNNADDDESLRLSLDECIEAMRKLETFNVTDLSVKICRFLKDK